MKKFEERCSSSSSWKIAISELAHPGGRELKNYFSFYEFFAKIQPLFTHVRKTPPLRSHYCLCLQAEGNVNRTLNVFELHSVTKKNHAHIVCNIKIYCNFLKFLMVLWFTEESNPAPVTKKAKTWLTMYSIYHSLCNRVYKCTFLCPCMLFVNLSPVC